MTHIAAQLLGHHNTIIYLLRQGVAHDFSFLLRFHWRHIQQKYDLVGV